MAKDSSAKRERPGPAKAPSLAALAAQVERLDRDLVRLFNERARLVVAREQVRQADPDYPAAPGVDALAVEHAEQLSKGPLPSTGVQAVFRELDSACRALHRPQRVAYLGPAYSYSHLATLERFGSSIDPVPVASIGAVFEEVTRAHADYGLVPVENSTDGRIADTLDMFTRLRVRVCGEVLLRIHHTLLGRCPRSEVAEVYSKPQALSQCRNWLARHLPAARTVEVTSTTTAAQLAAEKPGAAAIASRQAGVHYGLDVLAENIEDNAANVTRFFVLGQQSAARTGRDKTAAMFEVQHRPGALADAMNIFKRLKLNLTWIESFPIPRPEGGYLFFIELDGHETDLRVRKAFAQLGKKSLRMEVLGSYPRSQPIE